MKKIKHVIDASGHGTHHELYAYIAIDNNGQSGICAASTPLGMSPLVGMTRKDMAKWQPYAESIRQQTDKHILLVRYQDVEVIDE